MIMLYIRIKTISIDNSKILQKIKEGILAFLNVDLN